MNDNYQLFRRTTPDWVRMAIATACAAAMMALNGPPLVRQAVGFVFVTPVQKVVYLARTWVADNLVHSYRIATLTEQNQGLVAQNQAYAIRLQTLTESETESQALRAQLGLKSSAPAPIISAQALYQVIDPYSRKLVLNAGSNEGVQLGQPVVAVDGLVGQITAVQSSSSELTLITDIKVNVPVMVQRNPAVSGFVSGGKSEGYLDFRAFNPEQTDIQSGDILVTSGRDGLYPKGIAVAKVSNIAPADADGRSQLTIEPMMPPMNVRYVGILQVANLAEMKARSDAQIDMARTNDVPTTLGARTREQYTNK